MAKVMTLNKRTNTITKERTETGAWKYTVSGADGAEIASLVFRPGTEENRLLNSDLLDIVRDRLDALVRNGHDSFRAYNCLQHVYEALFWADAPLLKEDKEVKEKDGEQ
jgi:hypothetical protein